MSLAAHVSKIITAISQLKPAGRHMVAIAGAPGAGKSTLAEAVARALNENKPRQAAIVPMDGFHLDNAVLRQRGLLGKKGAPQTFDSLGFAMIMARLRAGDSNVAVPVFDRDLDLARAGGRVIPATTRILIVEGNYLLLDQPDWRQSAMNYDLSVMLDVPLAVLENRLIQRWQHQGLPAEVAKKRARGNDIANAKTVLNGSVPADITLATGQH